ncbi:type II toxin-antitoxin system VapC family toxin [Streptomyces sp. NPDC005279]|uniref:type II toxin-antitoxin system VapC family toxin n=1 Tax=Streptomyces sp. NPDC005279 TaxID=3364712 RepID=UPI0036A9B5A5
MSRRRGGVAQRCYIDSCVYIEVIKGRTGVGIDHAEQDYDRCLQVLAQFENGNLDVTASTMVYVEVFGKGEAKLHDKRKSQLATGKTQAAASAIIDSWFKSSPISWVEVHQDIAEDAREMAKKFHLDSQDAVHLATAVDEGCGIFYTLDRRLISHIEDGGGIPNLQLLLPVAMGQLTIPGQVSRDEKLSPLDPS